MKWTLLISFLLVSTYSHAADLVIKLPNEKVETLSRQTLMSQFPISSFTTQLPWFEETKAFSGVKVSELLKYYKLDSALAVSFIALNDYAASSTVKDILTYDPIIAYQMDGKYMKIRNKGPFWLVFDLDSNPEINNPTYYSQMVWQIDEIVIHNP